ncbi:MAG TPA: DUF4214 domain-containing protein, partial [Pyrinomonadaceae bacterium]|nr:DUF4214 domain-containing protein [Pyrinomonadaceae bacterium]
AQLGATATVPLTIFENDSSPSTDNPIDNTTNFVRQHYHDFLNREPDAAGLAFWSNEIELCGADAQCREVKRINVSAAFFLSIEFQETGFLVHRAYRAAFNRLPRFREFLLDTQELGQGVAVGLPGWDTKLEQNKRAYFEEMVGRAPFAALFGGMSNSQYVETLNANAGGFLTPDERQALAAGLDNGQLTRAEVLRRIAEGAAFSAAETNRAFVLMQYFGYLRRDADAPDFRGIPDPNFDGYNFWLTKLNQFGGNFVEAEMVKAFLISIEYRQRFGQ